MHPIVRLSAREPIAEGTRVAQAIRVLPDSPPPTASKLLVLVHGYNNTAEDAAESYQAFLENTGLHRSGQAGQVCLLHWPGNKRWGFVSFASYPFEIEKALGSASILQTYLANLASVTPGGWPLEVTLVCHSLGNRLGLELVDRCRGTPRLGFPRACLMAAAVPTFRIDPTGDLHAAARAIARSLTLYSGSDTVLHYAFPLGQTAAFDGFFPTAIGRFGHPEAGLWAARGNMGRYGYSHGDYWPGRESAAAWLQFLGAPVAVEPPSAVLPTAPPIASAEISARKLPARNAPGKRDLPSS